MMDNLTMNTLYFGMTANEILSLSAKVKAADVLVEALKFYANGKNYTEGLEIFGAQIHLKDYGQIAQQALATYNKLSEVKE